MISKSMAGLKEYLKTRFIDDAADVVLTVCTLVGVSVLVAIGAAVVESKIHPPTKEEKIQEIQQWITEGEQEIAKLQEAQ